MSFWWAIAAYVCGGLSGYIYGFCKGYAEGRWMRVTDELTAKRKRAQRTLREFEELHEDEIEFGKEREREREREESES